MKKFLSVTAWTLLATFVAAFVNAWAMTTLWRWFAAAQYGHGPSMGAWFGFAAIARVATIHMPTTTTTESDDRVELTKIIGTDIGRWIGVALLVGCAWLVGALTGWMQ